MDRICCIHEVKEGKMYVETWRTNDVTQVYDDLAHELIAKKMCQCSWIKSITRKQLYNGFIRIIVQYDNKCRHIYTIKNRQ